MSDGGPAFPVRPVYEGEEYSTGMSLRDYFAGQVLTGICADTSSLERAAREQYGKSTIKPEMLAAAAYQIADAMLKARES